MCMVNFDTIIYKMIESGLNFRFWSILVANYTLRLLILEIII